MKAKPVLSEKLVETPSEAIQGTQSVQRAVALLRLVAESGHHGSRASELAARLGLNLATTERLLRALAHEQLLERHAVTRHYRIGQEVVALGASRLQGFSLVDYFDEALTHIANESQDTAFLWMRSGNDAICLARREGRYPIRALAVEVGARRPLGAGAGPLAQLAFMPDAERHRIVKKNANRYAAFSLSQEIVNAMIERSRGLGFALNDGRIIAEMTAIGIPILNRDGSVVASLSVAAINARMSHARTTALAQLIRETIAPITPVLG